MPLTLGGMQAAMHCSFPMHEAWLDATVVRLVLLVSKAETAHLRAFCASPFSLLLALVRARHLQIEIRASIGTTVYMASRGLGQRSARAP